MRIANHRSAIATIRTALETRQHLDEQRLAEARERDEARFHQLRTVQQEICNRLTDMTRLLQEAAQERREEHEREHARQLQL